MVLLEDFLNRRNPDIDNSNTSPGSNTVHTDYSDLSGFEDWVEFNYKTFRSLYGDVLQQDLPSVPHDQLPIGLETEIWDEKQLELVFSKYILYPVRFALKQAYSFCQQSWTHNAPDEFAVPIDPDAGGRAKKSSDNDDTRFRPDWSAVKKDYKTSSTPPSYFNFCPGDTKLAKKWKFEWRLTNPDAWVGPPKQIQTYSGNHWNVRYGWIVTEEGLTCCLITREAVGPGLAAARESHAPVSASTTTPRHARGASGDTDISSLMGPLSITTESYREDHPHVDYKPIRMKSVAWNETRKGHLNVKTALFFLLMLAGAPGGPEFVQTDYPPLDSWRPDEGRFRHNATGRVKDCLQPADVVCRPSDQPLGTEVLSSGGRKGAVTQEHPPLARSVIEEMKWSDQNKMYYYWDSNNECQWITNGVIVLDEKSGRHGVFEEGRWTEIMSAQVDEGKQSKRRKIDGKTKH